MAQSKGENSSENDIALATIANLKYTVANLNRSEMKNMAIDAHPMKQNNLNGYLQETIAHLIPGSNFLKR